MYSCHIWEQGTKVTKKGFPRVVVCDKKIYNGNLFFIKRQIREGLHLESFNTFTQRQRSNPIWCQVIKEA